MASSLLRILKNIGLPPSQDGFGFVKSRFQNPDRTEHVLSGSRPANFKGFLHETWPCLMVKMDQYEACGLVAIFVLKVSARERKRFRT